MVHFSLFAQETVTFQCSNGWNLFLPSISLLKLTLPITRHSYHTLQKIPNLFILGSSSPELSRSLTFLSRHLSASLIKAQTQINPHFFSEKINSRLLFVIQSQKNNVILMKQTCRPKAIQRTPFGTARTEGKSFVRIKKFLCVL